MIGTCSQLLVVVFVLHGALSGQELQLKGTLVSPNPGFHELTGALGYSVSMMPDLDGDGLEDIIIGAPEQTEGSGVPRPGRVYVLSSMGGGHLHTLRSPFEVPDGRFGHAVSAVGDMDEDGVQEVLTGAPDEGGSGLPSRSGRAYLFSGSTGEMVYARSSPNAEEGGEFGYSVSSVEDLDGDGAGEIIIGAPGESSEIGLPGAGRAYLYSGQTGSLIASIISPDPKEEGRFGAVVVGGSEALALSAPGEWNGAGRVYLYERQLGVESAGGAHVGEPRLRVVGPSPCFGRAIFSLVLPSAQPVRVTVFDLLARRVCTVTDKLLPAGEQRIVWAGCDEAGRIVPNGFYVCSARIGHRVISAKVVIIR